MTVRNYVNTLVLQENFKSVTHEIQFNFDVTTVVVQGESDLVTALYSEVAKMPVSWHVQI